MKAEAEQQTDLAVARRLAGVARDVLDGTAGGVAPAAMIAIAAQARAAIPETAQLLRDALDLTPPASETAPIPWSWSEMAISADGRVQAFFREDDYRAFNDDVEPHATLNLLAVEDFATIASRREEGSSRPTFSPDGRWLVSGGAGRRLVLRDATSGEITLDEIYSFGVWPAFAPDGETLYAARTDGAIEVRHAPGWGVARTLSFPVDGDRGYPLTVRVSADGGTLLVVDQWRAAYAVPTDGSAVRTLAAFDGRRDLLADNAQEGALSPVDPLALVLRTRGVADLWNLATGERRATFEEPYYARAVAFSHDGTRVAAANHGGTVTLRRAADGERLNRWEHGVEVEALAFSPDDRLLASGGEDGTVAIWNAETGEAGPRLRRDGAILSLAFAARYHPGDPSKRPASVSTTRAATPAESWTPPITVPSPRAERLSRPWSGGGCRGLSPAGGRAESAPSPAFGVRRADSACRASTIASCCRPCSRA